MSNDQVDAAITFHILGKGISIIVSPPFQPSSFWSDCMWTATRLGWADDLAHQTERFAMWLYGVTEISNSSDAGWAYYASRWLLLRMHGLGVENIEPKKPKTAPAREPDPEVLWGESA